MAGEEDWMTNEDHGPRKLSVVGSTVRIILSGADTEGAFALVEDVTPPGGGPPPHVHHNEDEGFYVLEGDVEFLAGDRWFRGGPGKTFFGKRDEPHTFRNVGSKPSRVLVTIAPAGFESFFVEVDRLAANGPPTPDLLIELGKRYGMEFLPPR
jgi:quercetin dioxygenase-like cupin family protein